MHWIYPDNEPARDVDGTLLWMLAVATFCFVVFLFLMSGCPATGQTVKPRLRQPPFPLKVKDAMSRAAVVGVWQLEWRGGEGVATLRKEGGWECQWLGQRWTGHWEIRAQTLKVTEAIEPKPGQIPVWFTWEVALDPGENAGKIDCGGRFALLPPPKPRVGR